MGLAVMDAVGLPEPIRWRVMWLAPIPPLVGALAAGLAKWSRAGFLAPAAVGLGIVLAGLPIWSQANGVALGWPSWKWPADAIAANWRLSAVAESGDVIGVAESTGAVVATSSAQYWSVSPRRLYTVAQDSQEGFCAAERIAVADYSAGLRDLDPQVVDALEQLGVTVLVLPSADAPDEALSGMGFAPSGVEGVVRRGWEALPDAQPRCARPAGIYPQSR